MTFWFLFGVSMGLCNTEKRLSGYTENGLRWDYPDMRLRKYQFVDEVERNTWWGALRITEN